MTAESCELFNRVARKELSEQVTFKVIWKISEGESATKLDMGWVFRAERIANTNTL